MMSQVRSSQTFVGSRAWSMFGVGLILPTALIAGWFAIWLTVTKGELIAGLSVAAVALFMLAHAADSLARSIRPNRLSLDDHGLTLSTWRRTERWPWAAFRGIDGSGAQMLRVVTDGRRRAIAIGQWQRDLALRVHDAAARHGNSQAGPGHELPSAAPTLVLAGAILIGTLIFAWASLP